MSRTVHSYPFGPAVGMELHPKYAELRRTEPVARVRMPYGGEGWLVTRYADAKVVLTDPRFSMAEGAGKDIPRATEVPPEPGGLLALDPPEHSRLRKLLAKAFTARRIEAARPAVTALVNELVDDMLAKGSPADLRTHLALPLPMTVISDMLGVPHEDQALFGVFADTLMSAGRYTPAEIENATNDFMAYLADLVAQRRENPTDDVLGALVQARDDTDRLSEHELLVLAGGLLVGGHETTANHIGNFVYLLLEDRSRYEAIIADPGLIPAVVDELLRFAPLTTMSGFTRIATEDVQLGDVTVRAGEGVVLSFAVPNRDEEVFPDPERVDFHRERNPHLGLGHGVHHCLGAQLARMELQVTLRVLAERLPDLRLAVAPAELRWKTGMLVRGLEELPVLW
ncbi:cytochrome P450 [Allokutzneria sp. A3M-2-11 16]|uniref:cytochrome P450 n=1 Tax=Allokutzneria sp. A3M-2-11 16 TaxID=2962043 RepID=UPI0020B77D91|nr:cytochrome P450 [Allokutzneria sp. A3M-2-11 16]MCP3804661.1 cytochrome P450 [Allokutzneria sp. A3M-2-11 16]